MAKKIEKLIYTNERGESITFSHASIFHTNEVSGLSDVRNEIYSIRMIRRRYPKGTDFGKVSTAAIKDLEQWINNYPREILGWKTSAMCFRECLDAL